MEEVCQMNCVQPGVEITQWEGEPAVRMKAGGFEALIISSIGANLVELKNDSLKLDLIRSPGSVKKMKSDLPVYGIPVLLPPNRIAKAKFTVNNREYNFPINDVWDMPNHLYGFLYEKAWKVTGVTLHDDGCSVEHTFDANQESPSYQYFPHEFVMTLTYSLSRGGLTQKAAVTNKSNSDMPFGLGYHTAFNVPFHKEGKIEAVVMRVSAGKRWVLDNFYIPTGVLAPLEGDELAYRAEGVSLNCKPICHHYTAEKIEHNGKPFNGAIIKDKSIGQNLVYELDDTYKHWMLWNNSGNDNFICPEPQTMAADAPNLSNGHDVTGFIMIEPNGTWIGQSKIYVEIIGGIL